MNRLCALLCGIVLTACGGGSGTPSLIIATATPGGTYYPVGVAIGTLLSEKLRGQVNASAINSAGSGENIQMLVNNEAQLAILQGLYGAMAYNGTGNYDSPLQDFRSVTTLWQNVEHFVIDRRYLRGGTLEDLKSLASPFSVGKRGSGTEGSTRVIFSALAIAADTHYTPEYLGYSPSAQAMMDGRIAGASLAAGPPVAAVTQVFAQKGADGVAILNVTDDQLARIRNVYPVYTRHILKAGTYPGQTDDVQTMAQPNFLACRADLSEEMVYNLTRTLYENLAYLQKIHQATIGMSLDSAVAGLGVPLHPGALRYYREQGLDIPDALIAP